MKAGWRAGVLLTAAAIGILPAGAQTVIGAKSGVINWVEGDVFLADKPYVMQPSQFGEVKENMVLRTEEGRAEVLLPPGVFFRLGEKASFKMITNRLVDTRVELLAGSGIIEIDDIAKDAAVTVVCKDATIGLSKAGLYRFDTEPAQVKVFKGSAEVVVAGQTVVVNAGKMLPLGSAVAAAEKFNVGDTDSLDRWSHRRAEIVAQANVSAAKQAHYGGYGVSDPCAGWGGYRTGPFARPWGTWGYNPYYGLGTYIPCTGTLNSPYGFRYWSPLAVYRAFYAPRPIYAPPSTGGFGGFGGPAAYPTMGGSSAGYSGAVSAPSVSSSAPAAASSGSSAAAAAGGSSAGHGAAGGGGHGK
jgi:hypothetical protein